MMEKAKEKVSLASADNCPKCGASLLGEEIPEDIREKYGGGTHYKHTVGVEYSYDSPQHYDGVSEWMCPFCKYREGRWSGKELKEGEVEMRFGGK